MNSVKSVLTLIRSPVRHTPLASWMNENMERSVIAFGEWWQNFPHRCQEVVRSLATTKIWDVKSHLSQLIAYVSNKEKTIENFDSESLQALVSYGIDDLKTEERRLVTPINCTVDDAPTEMAKLNAMSQCKSETVAYHAYQSFARGEVDAEKAHQIGIRLANELWGNKNFLVVVATHVNTGTIHTHFAIGATARDLVRYNDCKDTYRQMREASDRLCREYGLSVIENPQRGQTRHIGEIKAEQEGRQTVRGQIRRDMDAAIKHCFTYPQFAHTFQSLGYTLEWRGKYLRIRPDESTRWFRMDKLGEGYTYEDVQRRLKENGINRSFAPYKSYTKREKPKGLVALYYHYCYLLGALPKEKPNNREAYAVIREDVKRARMYSEEAKLLGKYDIHTAEQLSSFTENLSGKFVALAKERAALRNRLRRMHDSVEMQPIKNQISELSRQMAVLRREMRLCEDIALRSGAIETVVNTIDIPDKDTPKKTQDKKKEERKV